MANSSDWVARLSGAPTGAGHCAPGWIEALGAGEGFREGFAFAAKVPPEPEQVPVPEPEEPDALAIAFAEGEAAGRAAMQADLDTLAARQRDLRMSFRRLDQSAMDALAQELSATVLALCEQVLDASAINPDGLIARANEAARVLGAGADGVVLYLNPLDIEMLADHAPPEWEIMPDPDQARGSLRLENTDGEVHDGPDGWRRAIAEALRA